MKLPLIRHLYVQVLIGITLGIMLGVAAPDLGVQMKPLGDAFVKLIKMLIAPIIFTTVVAGIAAMGDLKKVGRVGGKALIYFEIVTTLALVIGLIVVHAVQPGAGVNANLAKLDVKEIASFAGSAQALNTIDFVLHIIPTTFISAFSEGEMLQVLLLAILVGVALSKTTTYHPESVASLIRAIHTISHALMAIIGFIMLLAPIAAFGAMGYTIGKFGIVALASMLKIMVAVYATCILFVVVVLGGIMRWYVRISLWQVIRYIREELLIVLGTSSSESALPRIMAKLERLGCAKSVVGIVVPAGYSFNLDGTSIYLTMAAIFIAQATNTPLTIGQEMTILAVLMLTSKGAAAVTGGGFITLAATLSSVGTIPVAGLVLLVGVDRFMSEARALTNLIGNTVATLVIARWEGALDIESAQSALLHHQTAPTGTLSSGGDV
jgi:aerobic C4-dicarboxylate transport protein